MPTSCRRTSQEGMKGGRGDIATTPLYYPADGAVVDDNISVDFKVDVGDLVDRADFTVIGAAVADIADHRPSSSSPCSSSSSSSSPSPPELSRLALPFGRRQTGGWVERMNILCGRDDELSAIPLPFHTNGTKIDVPKSLHHLVVEELVYLIVQGAYIFVELYIYCTWFPEMCRLR